MSEDVSEVPMTLFEGTLRKYKGEWILETEDRKLFKVSDILAHYEKKEVRFIVADLNALGSLIPEES